MTELIRFLDDDHKGRWANIRMDNGDPCWVSIAQSGILVKKSKVGLFGEKLFNGSDIDKALMAAMALRSKYPQDLTPSDMRNSILKSIVNVILHCNNLAQVKKVLNESYENVVTIQEEEEKNKSGIKEDNSAQKIRILPLGILMPTLVDSVFYRALLGYGESEFNTENEKKLNVTDMKSILLAAAYIGAVEHVTSKGFDEDSVTEAFRNSLGEVKNVTEDEVKIAMELIERFRTFKIIREDHSFDDRICEAWWPMYQDTPYGYPTEMSYAIRYSLNLIKRWEERGVKIVE